MTQENAQLKRHENNDVFIPVLLTVVTILVMAGSQMYQLLQEDRSLTILISNQSRLLEDAQKVRTQFDSITTGAARLAEQGNPHAKRLLDELARQGVTIKNPGKATP